MAVVTNFSCACHLRSIPTIVQPTASKSRRNKFSYAGNSTLNTLRLVSFSWEQNSLQFSYTWVSRAFCPGSPSGWCPPICIGLELLTFSGIVWLQDLTLRHIQALMRFTFWSKNRQPPTSHIDVKISRPKKNLSQICLVQISFFSPPRGPLGI